MSGLAKKSLQLMRRFVRERRGATAVEFAFISIPLMMLMFGVLELAMILLVSATLDMATDFAARNIRTGVFQKSGAITPQDFEKLVCKNMNWLEGMCTVSPEGVSTGKLYVEAETFDDFAGASTRAPQTPDLFDPDKTCWSVGNPNDIVLVHTYFKWPIVTPLLQPIFQNYAAGDDKGRLISSARLFRNEPFDPALQPVGDRC